MSRDAVSELVALLSRLPGVGERTATRLAFHVLAGDPEHARALGESLRTLHERVHRCEDCGNFGDDRKCRICLDPRRDDHLICVVARVPDLIAIERTSSFRGRYHVLHGLVSPLDGVGPESLPLDALVARVRTHAVTEVIVATPLHVEGEATALYIRESLRSLGVSVTRIASGVPHGGELEYTDQVTLGRAFDGRKDL
jgi:recombination protein RecR